MTRKTRVREHSRKNAPHVKEHERRLSDDPRDILVKKSKVKVSYAPTVAPPGWEDVSAEEIKLSLEDNPESDLEYEFYLPEKTALTYPGFNKTDIHDYGGYNYGSLQKYRGQADWILHISHGDPERRSRMAYRAIEYEAAYPNVEAAIAALRSGRFWSEADEVGAG